MMSARACRSARLRATEGPDLGDGVRQSVSWAVERRSGGSRDPSSSASSAHSTSSALTPACANTDATARPMVALAWYAGMMTLTSTGIGRPRPAHTFALAMDDDAHPLRVRDDLRLAHV